MRKQIVTLFPWKMLYMGYKDFVEEEIGKRKFMIIGFVIKRNAFWGMQFIFKS